MDPIEALADCIMKFEGWYSPGSVTGGVRGSTSWRNRNPGNLRPYDNFQSKDDKGYRTFERLSDGWSALYADVHKKVFGESIHKLTPASTLTDFFNIYAPALDKNDPAQYSRQVALWLSKIYNSQVMPTTTLKEIMELGK
jgi:hypothetical protein